MDATLLGGRPAGDSSLRTTWAQKMPAQDLYRRRWHCDAVGSHRPGGVPAMFNIWNGPSVVIHVQGARLPPTHLDPNVRDGRFVDWPTRDRGATPSVSSARRLRFTSAAAEDPCAPTSSHDEYDPVAKQGHSYLGPQWTSVSSRMCRGNWLYRRDAETSSSRRSSSASVPSLLRTRSGIRHQCKGVAYLRSLCRATVTRSTPSRCFGRAADRQVRVSALERCCIRYRVALAHRWLADVGTAISHLLLRPTREPGEPVAVGALIGRARLIHLRKERFRLFADESRRCEFGR